LWSISSGNISNNLHPPDGFFAVFFAVFSILPAAKTTAGSKLDFSGFYLVHQSGDVKCHRAFLNAASTADTQGFSIPILEIAEFVHEALPDAGCFFWPWVVVACHRSVC
jgi:hypothetical protein